MKICLKSFCKRKSPLYFIMCKTSEVVYTDTYYIQSDDIEASNKGNKSTNSVSNDVVQFMSSHTVLSSLLLSVCFIIHHYYCYEALCTVYSKHNIITLMTATTDEPYAFIILL